MSRQRQKGSVALEYVIITTFTTIVAIALLGLVTTLTKEKLHAMSEKLGIDTDEVNIDVFN